MAQEQVAGPDGTGPPADPPPVVAFGNAGETAAPPVATRRLARLRADRRVVPTVAGVAAVAALGSLVTEWRIWALDRASESGLPEQQELTTGVPGLGAVGAGYLVGLTALAACVVLALFGAGPVRRHCRLVGLAVAGVLAATLLSASVYLEQVGGTIDAVILNNGTPAALMAYGRGLYLAYAAVAAAALALYLVQPDRRTAGRRPADEPASSPDDGYPGEAGTGDGDADEFGPDWPWRAPRAVPDRIGPGPVDLTVEPAAPFVAPHTERDGG